jgi:hypothetical protein
MTRDERAIAYPRAVPDFTPVPRRSRSQDGWTEAKQRGFIAALAETGSVRRAAKAVGMSFASAYHLRKAPLATSFVAAWDNAVQTGVSQVYDILVDHSVRGVPEPVFHAGQEVGQRRRFDHRTMRWIVERGGSGARNLKDINEQREREAADRAAWLQTADQFEAAGNHETAAYYRESQPMRGHALRIELTKKIDEMIWHERTYEIAPFPEKRAAYELLNGPVDWSEYDSEKGFCWQGIPA